MGKCILDDSVYPLKSSSKPELNTRLRNEQVSKSNVKFTILKRLSKFLFPSLYSIVSLVLPTRLIISHHGVFFL